MTDPIQQIEERYTQKYEQDGIEFVFATGTANTEQTYKDIQNLLKLIKAYEIIMDRSFVGTGEMEKIKKQIFEGA